MNTDNKIDPVKLDDAYGEIYYGVIHALDAGALEGEIVDNVRQVIIDWGKR